MKYASLVLAFALLAIGASARAHPLAPSDLRVEELEGDDVELRFRTPTSRPVGTELIPEPPAECERLGTPTAVLDGSMYETKVTLRCLGGVVGRTFRMRGLRSGPTDVLWEVRLRDGTVARGLLHGSRDAFVVPAYTDRMGVLADYIRLGVEHLFGGLDHVLFLLGLLFVLKRRRPLLLAVTTFTLGHSASLVLSALEVVQLPQGPVEVAIALSLFVTALEIVVRAHRARAGQNEPDDRRAIGICFGFGLVHGLGFAGVLAESGLPSAAVPEALFGFNLGIELGQLALIAIALLAAAVAARIPRLRTAPWDVFAAHVIGGLAAMWILERTLELFA